MGLNIGRGTVVCQGKWQSRMQDGALRGMTTDTESYIAIYCARALLSKIPHYGSPVGEITTRKITDYQTNHEINQAELIVIRTDTYCGLFTNKASPLYLAVWPFCISRYYAKTGELFNNTPFVLKQVRID